MGLLLVVAGEEESEKALHCRKPGSGGAFLARTRGSFWSRTAMGARVLSRGYRRSEVEARELLLLLLLLELCVIGVRGGAD
jgi:hypothetical protein